MLIRITTIDGKLPNLALMRLGAWHKSQGHDVVYTRSVRRSFLEPRYDVIYGSAIFEFSRPRLDIFRSEFPEAIIGGTGSGNTITVEDVIGAARFEAHDYAIQPAFTASIGMLSRGCRFSCKWCKVPAKEGKTRASTTVAEIWRGDPHPRHLHLLDNDLFGLPREEWQAHVRDIRDGRFKVCINQSVNIRTIDQEVAEALASIELRDDQFKCRRLYTAWDNAKDAHRFFRGVELLEKAGLPPSALLVYMLIGYQRGETWNDILDRFNRLAAIGARPFPMPYRTDDPQLRRFQRWAVRGYHRFIPWDEYDASAKGNWNTQQLNLPIDLPDARPQSTAA